MLISRFWVLLVLAIPVAEIFLLLQVGSMLGVWSALGLLLASAVLGVVLVRVQGMLVFRRLLQMMAQGQLPTREMLDSAVLLVAGILFLIPGFFTDFIGFLLLLPPVRYVFYGLFFRRVKVPAGAECGVADRHAPIEGVFRRDDQ